MTVTVVACMTGDPDWEKWLGPIADNPPPQIMADAEIDMSRTAQWETGKRWWIAVDSSQVLAWCAAWMADDDSGYGWICGHNYELRGRGREIDAYLAVFAARQEWIDKWPRTCVTYLFGDDGKPQGQAIDPHIAAGWTVTGLHGDGDLDGHHWWQLTYQPR
jgi:hypothetical protein